MPDTRPAFWDLARDHFGTHTPLTAFETIGQVLRAVIEGQATIGVLPLPQEDDRNAWWPLLRSNEPRQPRVFARLPFGDSGSIARAARWRRWPSAAWCRRTIGVDRSLLVLETGRS